MSSLASGNRRSTAEAKTCEHEWRISSKGDMGIGKFWILDWRFWIIRRRLLIKWFERVAVFAVEHGPTGSGKFGPKSVGSSPVF